MTSSWTQLARIEWINLLWVELYDEDERLDPDVPLTSLDLPGCRAPLHFSWRVEMSSGRYSWDSTDRRIDGAPSFLWQMIDAISHFFDSDWPDVPSSRIHLELEDEEEDRQVIAEDLDELGEDGRTWVSISIAGKSWADSREE